MLELELMERSWKDWADLKQRTGPFHGAIELQF